MNLAFLPDGELIVERSNAVVRLDASGQRVLAKRAAKTPAFAVSSAGRVYIADGSKVIEHDAKSLAPGKAVPFPSERGNSGALSSLAISPDGSTLAGVTRGDTLHVQALNGSARESHPGYGARRECLAFVGPRTVLSVRGNTVAELLTLGAAGPDAELHDLAFAAGGDGHVVTWGPGGDARLFNSAGKALGPLEVRPVAVAFAQGRVVIAAEDAIAVFDLKSRKQLARRAMQCSGLLAVSTDRIAVGTGDTLVLLRFPDLTPLGKVPAAPRPPVVAKPAAKAASARRVAVVKPSALRARLEQLGATSLGGCLTETQLKQAQRKLGFSLPAALVALWRDINGFELESGGGVNSLRAVLDSTAEDALWNDEFDDQYEGAPQVPLAKLKKLKVLWSIPGQAESIGIELKTGALFFGETNTVLPMKLKLDAYLQLAFEPDFIESLRARAASR